MPNAGDEKPIYLIAVHRAEGDTEWASSVDAADAKAALAFGTREDAEAYARVDADVNVYEIVEFARVPAPSKE